MKTKSVAISIVLLCLVLGLSTLQVSAQFCPRGAQVSEVIPGGNNTITFSYDVNHDNLANNIGRVDLNIMLDGPVVTPTFQVAIDPNTTSAAAMPPAQPLTLGAAVPQEFPFDDPNGRPYIDTARVSAVPGEPNRFRLIITFNSYYSFALHGPLSSVCPGPGDTTPNACLPSLTGRQIHVTLGNLNTASSRHLQVNAVSRRWADAPDFENLENEEANPARSFIDAASCAKPTDVILVLDHSSSMIDAASIGDPSSRILVLNQSMGTLFNIWKTAGQFNASDSAAAVFFGTSSMPQIFGGNFLVTFTATPNANPNLSNLITASSAHVIDLSQATGMGPGLNSALTGFANNDHYRHIVLFTDGEQNRAPCVKRSSATATAFCSLTGGALTDPYILNLLGTDHQLKSYAIPIHTIGTGSAVGTPYELLLRRIFFDTGGTGDFTNDGAATLGHGTLASFLQTFVNVFHGNTLGIVDFKTATINKGAGTSEQKFRINRSAKRLVFLLAWHAANPADQTAGALTMEVLPPGASTPIVIGENFDTTYHHIKSIIMPLPSGPTDHEGEWTLRVRENLTGAAQVYQAAAFVDESRLEYQFKAGNTSHSTGSAIQLQATVTQDDVPVKNLTSVTAQVTRPRTPLGTFMHTQQITPADLQTNPPGPPTDSFNTNFDRKLFRLVTNPAFQPLFEPIKDPQPVQLFDDGQPAHGDTVANDGTYSALYTNTKFPGQYAFDFNVTGNTATMGNFSRSERSTALVRVNNPDPDKSEVSIDRTLTAGERQITIVPADAFDNFLGPGFADEISITVSGGGTISGPITDPREDGTYVAKLVGVPSGANPTVTVTVTGKVIAVTSGSGPKKRFSVFGGIGTNFPHGTFNSFFDPGVSTQLGLEYRFTNRISAEGTFGYDRFNFAFGGGHQDLFRASGNLKGYAVLGTYQLGFFGGGGVYHFNSGGPTRGGVNFGVVNEFRINTSWSVEGTYNFHNVFLSGNQFRFSTVQGGVRFRF